ncbi:flavin reductase family protein [Candidatus Bipolaricaulota bacterium]|nr:flavin reductase family protein [Candidatus Bipolaricaulota bacterium]
MVQVAVWEENFSYELAQRAPAFVLQILGEGQQDLAHRFGSVSGRTVDKLVGLETFTGVTGFPILRDCLAYLECDVVFRWKAGDHLILVGRVIHSEVRRPGRPLIYDHADYDAPTKEGTVGKA